MHETDEELVAACLRREIAAEYRLYRLLAPKMYGICLRYAGNDIEADDILQLGFIRLFSRLHLYRGQGTLVKWSKTLFVRTAINYFHANHKYGRVESFDEQREYGAVSEGVTPYLSAGELLGVIRELPPGYRSVFNLYVVDNFSHKEIAALLGITESASRSQLARARQMVRERIGRSDERYLAVLVTAMEPLDPLDRQIREAFSGFQKEPPPTAWEKLAPLVAKLPHPTGLLAKLLSVTLLSGKPLGFYLTVAGAGLVFLSGIIGFSTCGRHEVRGHAYAGHQRLKGGMADLFSLADSALPWDSVTHYRSAYINPTGHFRFPRVKQGRYLLRVAPASEVDPSGRFDPAWLGGQSSSDSAAPVSVGDQDVMVEVRLLRHSSPGKQP